MAELTRSRAGAALSLAVIAAVVGAGAAAFAYTAGWLTPSRLTSTKMADAFGPKVVAGHRLNHAKGVCFTGTFRSGGGAATLSTAPMLAAGAFPVVGRFNLGTPDPFAQDGAVRVRGLGLMISTPSGAQWRTAMINAPVFAVSTPAGFYALQQAGGSKDPDAMKRFAATHPESAPFLAWAKGGPWTGSYAEERYNGLDAFTFMDGSGVRRVVRWWFAPEQAVRPVAPAQVAAGGPDALEREITARVAAAPARWRLLVQVASPGDPTADPSRAWPSDRRTVAAGELVADRIIPEPAGPCRDLNFDPTVLPVGMAVSDDPFPAARSAVYARSFDRRTAHAANYPRDAAPFPPADGPAPAAVGAR